MSIVKLQLNGGSATPGPPIGPALAGKGINGRDVAMQFNARTQDRKGELLRLTIEIDEGAKTFELSIKNSPAATLIKKAAKLEKGSSEPNRKKVGEVSLATLEEIAALKRDELNAFDQAAAVKMLAGTARSMGINVIS